MLRFIWQLVKPNPENRSRISYRNLSEEEVIFICGHPRSGSTYLYQKYCETGRYSYVTNLGHALTRFSNRIDLFKGSNWVVKASNEGYITGLNAPSEANSIFELWFGMNKDGSRHIGLWDRVNYYGVFRNKSWVFAWNAAIFFYDELLIMFPNAQFIIIDRDRHKIERSWIKACKKYGKRWGISGSYLYESETIEDSVKLRMNDIDSKIEKLREESNVTILNLELNESRYWLLKHGVTLNDYQS